ncbi:hypothetical protein BD324DRAFT_626923 [Kockovaella imperatae]|uniref:Uncharacterized protein n=1 Tax=Kockovaella imperatae TaxID=4999 RepID=A0A1Y1UGT3_9TREE|nr:hypothetical protein BD324DRAFT_626923 [Kockovaella imperatae]ORX36716.1 hypothetical protein BD324DRAFT_626923 [Kockovaella imperatae]
MPSVMSSARTVDPSTLNEELINATSAIKSKLMAKAPMIHKIDQVTGVSSKVADQINGYFAHMKKPKSSLRTLDRTLSEDGTRAKRTRNQGGGQTDATSAGRTLSEDMGRDRGGGVAATAGEHTTQSSGGGQQTTESLTEGQKRLLAAKKAELNDRWLQAPTVAGSAAGSAIQSRITDLHSKGDKDGLRGFIKSLQGANRNYGIQVAKGLNERDPIDKRSTSNASASQTQGRSSGPATTMTNQASTTNAPLTQTEISRRMKETADQWVKSRRGKPQGTPWTTEEQETFKREVLPSLLTGMSQAVETELRAQAWQKAADGIAKVLQKDDGTRGLETIDTSGKYTMTTYTPAKVTREGLTSLVSDIPPDFLGLSTTGDSSSRNEGSSPASDKPSSMLSRLSSYLPASVQRSVGGTA